MCGVRFHLLASYACALLTSQAAVVGVEGPITVVFYTGDRAPRVIVRLEVVVFLGDNVDVK